MTDPSTGPAAPSRPGAEEEVVELCRDLIRIDTTNTGDDDTTVGEAEAAEYVMARLQQVGLEPVRIETTGPTRQAVAVRIPGRDPDRGALLVHGHLDVVPAHAADWTADPFAAELADGMIWGRGAVDMKDMDAMILSAVRHWQRTGLTPERDVVVLFTPDEEAGGRQGAHWLVDHHPELFQGVTEAVGEVGGFSLTLREDLRVYLIQVAEKGLAWMRLRARAPAGHGSFVHDRSAVLELAEAVSRVGRHRFPVEITPPVAGLVRALGELLEVPIDPRDAAQLTEVLGPIARIVGATLHHTANPTVRRRLSPRSMDGSSRGAATSSWPPSTT